MQNYIVRLGEEMIHLGGEPSTIENFRIIPVKASNQYRAIEKAAKKVIKAYHISPLVLRVVMISEDRTLI